MKFLFKIVILAILAIDCFGGWLPDWFSDWFSGKKPLNVDKRNLGGEYPCYIKVEKRWVQKPWVRQKFFGKGIAYGAVGIAPYYNDKTSLSIRLLA